MYHKKYPKIDAKYCECTIDSCRTAHVEPLCLPKEYNFNEVRNIDLLYCKYKKFSDVNSVF